MVYLPENFKETYDGVVEVDFLSFLDLEFFEGKLFHEPISDVDVYISSANKLITSIKNRPLGKIQNRTWKWCSKCDSWEAELLKIFRSECRFIAFSR